MVLKAILRLPRTIDRLSHRVGDRRACPVCEHKSGRFRPFGVVARPDAACPWCGALERHRLLWLFLLDQTDLFDGRPRSMLHVAPEPVLEQHFRERIGEGYLTADLFDPRAMVRMDITDIDRPDGTFDVIYCSHVLEHVEDDRKAMREMCRVLKPDGWAILLVPITEEITFEDPSITDPRERLRVFGQEDHVRRYGRDYPDRLREAGFDVEMVEARDFLESDRIERMAITPAAGEIFVCRKQTLHA